MDKEGCTVTQAMLLKDLSARYNLEDESRWPAASRQLMICAVAMDPLFKSFASKLVCEGGESARQGVVWATERDKAIQHRKFEEEKET